MPPPPHIPKLHELPLQAGHPPRSAWGLWGEAGDALGSLNWLNDEKVLTAAKEIRTGQRIPLNCPLDKFDPPLLGRAAFSQEMINKDPLVVNDDKITFNTQGSSQWDSLRHFAFQKERQFYNGVTQDDIYRQSSTPMNGLSACAPRGIVGRGVLVDFVSWAEKHGKSFPTFEQYGIELADIRAIVQEQGTTLQRGDILLVRTGYVRAYGKLSAEERIAVAGVKEWCGIAQSEAMTEWLWEHQFAAVASDSPGFECRPPTDPAWHLHPILLAGWGTPIGELFDLEELAETCKREGRWSFFLTSCPLNYTGAVASPPNALAIM